MMVHLRALRLGDIPYICEQISDLDVLNYMGDDIPYPYTEKHAQAFLAETADMFPLYCAIQVDEEFAGVVSLREKGDIYRVNLELGYWLGKAFWGNGIMTEAIRQITNVAFRQYQITRVFANVFECNQGSRRALEKNGYEQEGYHRNALFKNGEIHDCVVYAMIKEEWFQKQTSYRHQSLEI